MTREALPLTTLLLNALLIAIVVGLLTGSIDFDS